MRKQITVLAAKELLDHEVDAILTYDRRIIGRADVRSVINSFNQARDLSGFSYSTYFIKHRTEPEAAFALDNDALPENVIGYSAIRGYLEKYGWLDPALPA